MLSCFHLCHALCPLRVPCVTLLCVDMTCLRYICNVCDFHGVRLHCVRFSGCECLVAVLYFYVLYIYIFLYACCYLLGFLCVFVLFFCFFFAVIIYFSLLCFFVLCVHFFLCCCVFAVRYVR